MSTRVGGHQMSQTAKCRTAVGSGRQMERTVFSSAAGQLGIEGMNHG